MNHAIVRQLRHQWGRAIGLVLVIAFATGSFVVLTASSSTSKLQVVDTVNANYQGAYDVLVRPPGSRVGVEATRGLVRPNFLSGQFGGISMAQWRTVQRLAHVEVAAPVAMIGYVLQQVSVTVDVTDAQRPGNPALFVATVTRGTDAGLTSIPDTASGYTYVTDNALEAPGKFPDDLKSPYGVMELRPDGRRVLVCPASLVPQAGTTAFDPQVRRSESCWSRRTGRAGPAADPLPAGHVGVEVKRTIPFLLAAIDPQEEAALVGLDTAMSRGKFLSNDRLAPTASGFPRVPVLMVDRPGTVDTDRIVVRRLPPRAAHAVSTGLSVPKLEQLLTTSNGPVVAERSITTLEAYRMLLQQQQQQQHADYLDIDSYYTVGSTTYTEQTGGLLAVQPTRSDDGVWVSEVQTTGFAAAPSSAHDVWFRQLHPHAALNMVTSTSQAAPLLVPLGTFSGAGLRIRQTAANKVPMETYDVPSLLGADSRSQKLLRNQALSPTDNPAGYLQSPPTMLTNLASMRSFTSSTTWNDAPGGIAPISAIRVRVRGVTGADPVSRERVRLVAEAINRKTGLDVDITVGSSPSEQTIALPAGGHGRPTLVLHESWVKKGVATAVLEAIDRKSVVLFILVLLVSASFVANATTAAVRSRRRELAVLSCLGWGRGAIARLVMLELGLVGVTAGAVGAALAASVGSLTDVPVSAARAASAVPASVLLALVAAVVPALRASGAHPAGAIRPAVTTPRRARQVRTVRQLALTAVRRVPGRTAVAALSLSVGVCALTLLLAVSWAFRGSVVGSVLGDAVAVQVRGIDTIAVAITLALSCAAVADVVYVGLRERGAELAALQAVGWGDRPILALVAWEAACISLLGATVGAGLGLVGTALLAGSIPPQLVLTTMAAAVAGVLITIGAAIVPGRRLLGHPTARLLAGE